MSRNVEINLDILTDEIGIDKNSVVELLSIYSSEMAEEMEQIKVQTEARNWPALQRIVHNVKGVSANLYLEDMYKASEYVDLILKRSEYSDIDTSIKNLLSVFKDTSICIKEVVNGYVPNTQE